MSEVKLRKYMVKLHKNLAHKSDDQLSKLFKLAGKDTPEIKKNVRNVVETSNICNIFRKTPPHP